MAVAISVSERAGQNSQFAFWALGLAVAGIILGSTLAVLIVRSFRGRRLAEERVDAAMRTLITHTPDRFLPRIEKLMPELVQDNA